MFVVCPLIHDTLFPSSSSTVQARHLLPPSPSSAFAHTPSMASASPLLLSIRRAARALAASAPPFFTTCARRRSSTPKGYCFQAPPSPLGTSATKLFNRGQSLTVKDVVEWSERTGGYSGRLSWYETWAPTSPLYTKVAKVLLSVRATGSIDLERMVKPLKHYIQTKERNRLQNGKAELLLEASLNLKYLEDAKLKLKMRE